MTDKKQTAIRMLVDHVRGARAGKVMTGTIITVGGDLPGYEDMAERLFMPDKKRYPRSEGGILEFGCDPSEQATRLPWETTAHCRQWEEVSALEALSNADT